MFDNVVLKQTINKISSIKSLQMDPKHLALDVLALSSIFIEVPKFEAVANSVIHAIQDLSNDASVGDKLEYDLAEWMSYHFSSPYPAFPGEVDMRIVYQSNGVGLLILGFGHRYIPEDFYKRFKNRI